MPYPPQLVDPMRKELTSIGVDELLTPEGVDRAMEEVADRTALVIINSVCGCAAGNARPAVRLAMHAPIQPDRYLTVFAGQELEATAKMRSYLQGIPPSSPFLALFKNGRPVFLLERRNIEGRSASAIAYELAEAYRTHCNQAGSVEAGHSGGSEETFNGGNGASTDSTGSTDSTSETFRSIL